jgi:hypothetical protein
MMIRLLTLVFLVAMIASDGLAVDWSDCAGELDRLRRAARDAADCAETAQSKKSDLESKKQDLENCLSYPKMYDYARNNCQSQRWDYDSALREYQSAVDSVSSELDTVNSRIKSASWACSDGIGPGAVEKHRPASKADSMCELYKRYKGKLPNETLLETCKKNMSESECRKCLDLK